MKSDSTDDSPHAAPTIMPTMFRNENPMNETRPAGGRWRAGGAGTALNAGTEGIRAHA
ncbi:hypothetical protein SAMN06296416_10211 [Pseudoxanthomonas wuyuanensis]|uniref:Uncharacterized protein n=1 Tax=Pseudoxanthomonas wuyuanensis TaxID=1073196 RepID=A0A286D1W3_9GAMM|nr:hypothetical protein SAMN06296416_10211 [Pseudoxanthomonas wuyuanensis]